MASGRHSGRSGNRQDLPPTGEPESRNKAVLAALITGGATVIAAVIAAVVAFAGGSSVSHGSAPPATTARRSSGAGQSPAVLSPSGASDPTEAGQPNGGPTGLTMPSDYTGNWTGVAVPTVTPGQATNGQFPISFVLNGGDAGTDVGTFAIPTVCPVGAGPFNVQLVAADQREVLLDAQIMPLCSTLGGKFQLYYMPNGKIKFVDFNSGNEQVDSAILSRKS
jgi:hypothetical protein